MGFLKRCPQCYAKLHNNEKDMQVCKVCGYWTKKGTVILEPLLIGDSIVLTGWEE